MDRSTESSDSDNDIESQSANESFEKNEIDDEVSSIDKDYMFEHDIPSIETDIMDNGGEVEENTSVVQPTEGEYRRQGTH